MIKVVTDDDGTFPGFNGNDPKNIVNRLAANGIQIEQSKKAREKYHKEIAKAVAEAIALKIKGRSEFFRNTPT